MPPRSNPTFLKRQKELARKERQKEKAAQRAGRADQKKERQPGDEDPDIAGIVPGPQPPSDGSE
jgi:hypothetical protein